MEVCTGTGGTGIDVVPNLPKCPVPVIPAVYTDGIPRYVPYRTHPCNMWKPIQQAHKYEFWRNFGSRCGGACFLLNFGESRSAKANMRKSICEKPNYGDSEYAKANLRKSLAKVSNVFEMWECQSVKANIVLRMNVKFIMWKSNCENCSARLYVCQRQSVKLTW